MASQTSGVMKRWIESQSDKDLAQDVRAAYQSTTSASSEACGY
jgi:hypothetical protein